MTTTEFLIEIKRNAHNFKIGQIITYPHPAEPRLYNKYRVTRITKRVYDTITGYEIYGELIESTYTI